LTEYHPLFLFRGERQDIRRTVEERSTQATDGKKLSRANPPSGLALRRLPEQPDRVRHARNPPAHFAILRALAAPILRRPGRAAPAQSAESPIETGKSAAAGRKDLILVEDGRVNIASGLRQNETQDPHRLISAIELRIRKIEALRKQTDTMIATRALD